jgi:NAD(P)-dependent dehydrogenase (short-subunit alcohol dehydrogenase family)
VKTVAPTGRLSGAHAVVTGAAGGIGLAIAQAFAAADARVLLADIGVEAGEAACESFRRLDVTRESDWVELAADLERDPPDVLVNNAGGLLDSSPLHEASLAAWTRTIDLNLTSVFLGMRALLPLMLPRQRGTIINVCSVSGIAGQSDAPAYQAAKAGVLLLTRNAAVTYGSAGIRVNALTPSVVETPGLDREAGERTAAFLAKVPMGRAASAAEIAAGAVYLASSESSYVNGANLVIDGGYLA